VSVDCLKQKHILYLIDELKVKGGTEKHLYELAIGMADAGFRVSIFALAEGEYAEEFKINSKISYLCLNVKRIYDVNGLSTIFSISRYIKQQKVDIVQSFHTASDLLGPIAARLSFQRIKVLSSRRDLGYTKSHRHVQIQRYINHFVDGILANSTAVKNSIIANEQCAADKIYVIFNGIDVKPFASDSTRRRLKRDELKVDADAILIGSVGNIRPVKGYDLLVEAASKVCRDNSAVRFFHVGDGDMKEPFVKRCSELGIAHKFIFLGALENVIEFLSALDIYVQPSRSEGFSNAILEAMASGLPVVATSVGGNNEIVENGRTGFLVASEDIENLADRILKLTYEADARRSMGALGQEKTMSDFDLFHMIHNYERYYNELL